MTPEPNYVLTANIKCGECGQEEALPFDAGKPLSQIQFPVTMTRSFICPNCGPKDPVSVTLTSIPGKGTH
jgi:transcription elongation factor Elf1